MSKHTPSQQLAVDVTECNLLVSAGAGAGKTSSLISRLYNLLSRTKDPVGVEDLLIVTFTRAAAQEMKTRLQKRLNEALAASEPGSRERQRLHQQILLLPRARMSTIHSFCLQVITAHGERIGLAPGFDVMPENEARLEHTEYVIDRLERTFRDDPGTAAVLRRLIEARTPGSAFQDLVEWIIGVHGFLDALPDPERWVADALDPDAWNPDSPRIQELTGECARLVLEKALPLARRLAAFPTGSLNRAEQIQAAAAGDLVRQIEAFCANIRLSDLETFADSLKLPNARTGATKSDVPNPSFGALRESLVKALSALRKAVGPIVNSDLAADAAATRESLRVFLETCGLRWNKQLFVEKHLKERRLTFAHLERLAHQLLVNPDGTPSEVARLYRAEIRYILVDEFQDVNRLQFAILKSIAREGSEGGNFFCVGDVKQSIYEFRQAEPDLFLNLYNESVPLTAGTARAADNRLNFRENFRSHPDLLRVFNHLFGHLLIRETIGVDYGAEHSFVPGRTGPGHSGRKAGFSLTILPKDVDFQGAGPGVDGGSGSLWPTGHELAKGVPWWDLEAAYVARRVREIGPPWRHICILLRSASKTAPSLVAALKREGVPVYTELKSGLLTAVEIIEFRALIKTIDNPHSEVDLLGTLRGPVFRWTEENLLDLRLVGRNAPLITNLRNLATLPDHPLHRKAAHAVATLERWQAESTRRTMNEFFSMLFEETGLLDAAAVRPDGDQRRKNLEGMLVRASEFDGFLRKGLAKFVGFLDELIEEEKDFSPPSALAESADVVRIMTVHASKGLEFPVVIVPYIGRQFNDINQSKPFLVDRDWGAAGRIRDDREAEVDKPAHYRLLQHVRRKKDRNEELRLLYVALTRAEEAVHLVGSCDLDEAMEGFETAAPLDAAGIIQAASRAEWLLPLAKGIPMVWREATTELLDMPTMQAWRNEYVKWYRESAAAVGDGVSASRAEVSAAMERIQALGRKEHELLLRAKLSVTEAKRLYDQEQFQSNQPVAAAAPTGRIDWMPEALRDESAGPPPARVGTLTHRFLANLDLSGHGKVLNLTAERDRMVREDILTAEEAAAVSLRDVAWFFSTPLSQRIRELRGRIERERAFTIRVEGGEIHRDATGRPVILQGILDMLFETPDGWVIVDWKTDFTRGDAEKFERLVAAYSIQMQLYRLMVEKTLRVAVTECWLVFLREQKCLQAATTTIPWQDVLRPGVVVTDRDEESQPTVRSI